MAITRTLLVSLLSPALLAAQQPIAAPLKPANGTVSAGFTNVSSMQEFSDGRVLMSDLTSQVFGIGDFATGKFERITNVNPGQIKPLAADTSLLAGATQAEWVFLVHGHPIGMLPRDNPVVAVARLLWGADSMGRVLATVASRTHEDSTREILVSRTTGAVDTVVALWQGPELAYDEARFMYHSFEHADLALDGWISVLRRAPYRVDWRTPEGRWILGAPIPYVEVALDDREKQFIMQRRAHGDPPASPATITNWPATVEPWEVGNRSVRSPDGKLLVVRTTSADFPNLRYDVVGHDGKVERQVVMGPNERIIGFGSRSVYVTVTANNGPQSVQRHPWP